MSVETISTDLMGKYQKKLERSVTGSFYGKNIWMGLHSTLEKARILRKIRILATTIFGAYFAGITSYYSFDGATRIVKWSIEERLDGNPLPSDIGHGGEWILQPIQNLLAIHLCYLSTLANEGHLSKVKRLYAKLTNKILEDGSPVDISHLYSRFEEDFKYLARRSFRSTNLFEIKQEMIAVFGKIDTSLYFCPPLDLDRSLQDDYLDLLEKIQKLDNWNLNNVKENWRLGISQLGRRGVVQAVEKGAYFSLFQVVLLISSAFLIFGLSIVIDEVFISKTGRESSGHLSEWSINIMTNFLLSYFCYLFLIKREAMLVRTRRVMKRYLEKSDEGEPTRKNHLVETMNEHLDHLAEKCHFTHLPSSYRIRTEPHES